jgi:hypothetical protein
MSSRKGRPPVSSPGERVLNTEVHPLGPDRRMNVCSVAGQEHAADAVLGHLADGVAEAGRIPDIDELVLVAVEKPEPVGDVIGSDISGTVLAVVRGLDGDTVVLLIESGQLPVPANSPPSTLPIDRSSTPVNRPAFPRSQRFGAAGSSPCFALSVPRASRPRWPPLQRGQFGREHQSSRPSARDDDVRVHGSSFRKSSILVRYQYWYRTTQVVDISPVSSDRGC